MMPIHDWTRVDAGIFHHFHQRWIGGMADVLNQRLLPSEYYALAERHGETSVPDMLTLKALSTSRDREWAKPETGNDASPSIEESGNRSWAGPPLVPDLPVRSPAETDLELYRRKQNVVAVRHVSGDRLVAVVEVVSKANKSGRKAFEDFVRKAAELLNHQIHLLILDVQPTTSRDPQGIHGVIWDEIAGESYTRPADKPLTLVAYEANGRVRAFIELAAVGDTLIDMPLYLEPGHYVAVPLEETYQTAFEAVPSRWRSVIEAS